MSYYEQSTFGAVGSNYSGAYGGFDGQGESVELREAVPIDGKGGVVPGPGDTSGSKEVYDLTPLPSYAPQAMPAQAAVVERSSFPWVPVLVLGGLAAAGAAFIAVKNKQAAT